MKTFLLRIAVLGTLGVLGIITIAHGQRGGDDTAPDELSDQVAAAPIRPTTDSSPDPSANPLRASAPSPDTHPAMSDPFAMRSHPNESAEPAPLQPLPSNMPAPPSRYPAALPVSAEQDMTGPALGTNSPTQRSGDRYAGQYGAKIHRENQEPAPFNADPSATPANPQNIPQDAAAPHDRPDDSFEAEGTGQPGIQQLEGAQTPQLTIQKLAPKEIQVGKPASFRITVRNTGKTPASQVEIHDTIPKGTRLLGTTGQATRTPNGDIVWSIGTIRPNEESTVEMQVMPIAEGEIGSVATVHFGIDASARTLSTRPQLVVETVGPSNVLIGEQAKLIITVSNPGTGVATGVVLEERIPPGLQHSAGTELEYEVGDLKPGETRKLELPLLAVQPGPATNVLTARADGNLRTESKLDLEVLSPLLDVAMEGPKRRYLERQATYQFSISNPGTAPAKQVELVANLPPGLKFISANNAGYYEEQSRTVRWRLEELPANETGSVQLVTMPVEAGQHAIRLRGTAQKGLSVEKEQPVIIEGIAAILFQVADSADPIEIGGETTYEVRVVNQGSKASSNIRLAVILPPELKLLAAEGPTRHSLESDRVVFEGLARLAPKAETAYRLRVKALKPGDLRISFQLLTDDMQTPVTKEESTRVYADE